MLCKKCGKELPIRGQFCPFCGAETEMIGANDETAAFVPPTEAPGSKTHDDMLTPSQTINVSDLDAAIQKEITNTIRTNVSGSQQTKETTYFDEDETPSQRVTPYKKPGKGKKVAIFILVVAIIAAIAGGVVYWVQNSGDNEYLSLAERYMQQGKFEEALENYQLALVDAKDPSAIEDQISYLEDYFTAQNAYEAGEYTQALAYLNSLYNRLPDQTTKLASAIEALITDIQDAQNNAAFSSDLQTASGYIEDGKLDQASGILDGLEAESDLSSDQKKQISSMREALEAKKAEEQSKQESEQKQQETRSSFSTRMDELEAYDRKLSSASTTQESLEITSSSYESWDVLLSDMYDTLETTLNVDAYAAEETSYKDWITERDTSAKNAYDEILKKEEDPQSDAALAKADLARVSILHSYTRARCYKMLEKI